MLSNRTDWSEYYYKKGYLVYLEELNETGLLEGKYIIWPSESHLSILSAVRAICSIHNGISFWLKEKDYIEGFGFGTKQDTNFDFNSLISKVDLLERFSLYFKSAAFDIIEKCNTKRIIHPNRQIFSVKPLLTRAARRYSEEKTFRKKFIRKTPLPIKKAHPGLDLSSQFSKRELECIKYFLLGKSMREIGEQLFISPRTVETHLENIKIKMGCSKKSDLIPILLKIKFVQVMLEEYLI
jgi:DNA-binding CsgD family transcriptional regulator